MKNNIYFGMLILIAMFSFAILGVFKMYETEKTENKRVTDNISAILTDKAHQQELTVRELKTLYPKYDSLAKKLELKTRNVTNIIETQYRFKDSTLSKTIIKQDSLTEKRLFSISGNCYNFSGYLHRDTLAFTDKQFDDQLTTFLFKDWKHRYFFNLIKTKPYFSARVFSKCLNDTISVQNNIKISR